MTQSPILFVRGAWWHYKMPPPIMLLTLLLAGRTTVSELAVALASEVAVIALVCNFGYAINEIFDVKEDARTGRRNVASIFGTRRVALIAAFSAAVATALAWYATGIAGAALTAGALLISLAYSVPPIRLKDRRWLGALADAAAAHLYPVLLCFVIASWFEPPNAPLVVAAAVWSLALGVRGILVHQLVDEEADRESGLTTVVHIYGRGGIIRWVKFAVAPLEIGALIALCWLAGPGPVFWAMVLLYVLVEQWKVLAGAQGVLFAASAGRHVPFLNNSFYESWGPLAALADASWTQPAALLLLVAYVVLFWRRVFAELRAIAGLAVRLAMTLGVWPGGRRYGR